MYGSSLCCLRILHLYVARYEYQWAVQRVLAYLVQSGTCQCGLGHERKRFGIATNKAQTAINYRLTIR